MQVLFLFLEKHEIDTQRGKRKDAVEFVAKCKIILKDKKQNKWLQDSITWFSPRKIVFQLGYYYHNYYLEDYNLRAILQNGGNQVRVSKACW